MFSFAYLNVLSSKFHIITVGEATYFAFLNPSANKNKIKINSEIKSMALSKLQIKYLEYPFRH